MTNRRGFILLTISITLLVLAILTHAITRSGGLAARTAIRAMDAERARLLAEAGLAHALRNMQSPTAATPSTCSYNAGFTLGAADATTSYLNGGIEGVGTYAVGFIRQGNDGNGARPVLLEAVGTLSNGTRQTLRLPLPTLTAALPGWTSSQSIAATAVASADTFVRSANEWDPYYWANYLEIDGPGSNEERVLLRFGAFDSYTRQYDLAAAFPGLASNSRILHVRLGLYQSYNSGTASNALTAHRITQDWILEETTWRRRYGGTDWSSVGGSHDATALGSMAYISGAGMRWMELNTSIIGQWLPATNNFGLLLKASTNTAFRFYSLNYDESWNNDSTWKMRAPRLEIVYLKGC